MLSVDSHMTYNSVPTQSVLSPLTQELESLGISVKHMAGDLNDNKELENLADNLKDEFLKEIRKMEEKGIFVNPGGG
jgi:DNA polymerase I-like protein with 3'-5' exonuclease and polymerase domains